MLRGEIEHELADFFGAAMAPERDQAVEEFAGIPADGTGKAGFDIALEIVLDRAGRYHIDPDAPGRGFLGDRPHQADHGVLGGGIGGDAGIAGRADYAGGDDDAAAVAHDRDMTFPEDEVATSQRPGFVWLERAAEAGLLISVTADTVIRIVPPLILSAAEADEIVARLAPLVKAFLAEQA